MKNDNILSLPRIGTVELFSVVFYAVFHVCTVKEIETLFHQDRGASVNKQQIPYIVRKVSGREIYFHLFVWEIRPYVVYGRDEVAVGGNERKYVSVVCHGIGYHPDRNIYVCTFFFWFGDMGLAVGAFNFLSHVFPTDYFKPFSVQRFVGIKERALPDCLGGAKRRSRKIHDFFNNLVSACKLFAQLYHVNPIGAKPTRVSFHGTFQSIVEIETIEIENNSFHNTKKAARKRLCVPPRKEGDALVLQR